jgi:hypothetical protein
VRYRSGRTEGPTVGTETVDRLEFLARITAHNPDTHQVMTRYTGWSANRVRGRRRRGAVAEAVAPRAGHAHHRLCVGQNHHHAIANGTVLLGAPCAQRSRADPYA